MLYILTPVVRTGKMGFEREGIGVNLPFPLALFLNYKAPKFTLHNDLQCVCLNSGDKIFRSFFIWN